MAFDVAKHSSSYVAPYVSSYDVSYDDALNDTSNDSLYDTTYSSYDATYFHMMLLMILQRILNFSFLIFSSSLSYRKFFLRIYARENNYNCTKDMGLVQQR